MGPSRTYTPSAAGRAWAWGRRHPGAFGGGVVLVGFSLAALGAPVLTALAGQDPTTFHEDVLNSDLGGVPRGSFGGISTEHWLGVEPGTGRDIFARIVYGARVSLGVALGATALQVLLGSALGLLAGYAGGWLDNMIARAMDMFLALPGLLLAIALIAVVPNSFPRPVLLVAVIGVLGWAGIGRMVRGQVIAQRRRDYVDAARLLGAGPARIVLREILPNLATPIIAYTTLLIPGNVLAEAGLSFLGVGIRQPTPSWGEMLSGAPRWLAADPMYVVIPGAMLMLTVLAFNLVGDAARDTLDPRDRR